MPRSGAPFAELGDALCIGFHLVVREPGLAGQRFRAVALDGAADLAIDDARRVHGLEQVDHRLDAILVLRDLFVDQRTGEPAAAKGHVGLLQDRKHDLGIFREAAAHFHAGEARRARLAQAFLQRHVIAEFRQIVVPPRNGGHAQFCLHIVTPVSDPPDAPARADAAGFNLPPAAASPLAHRPCGLI